jgi:hypothetical protein
MTIQQLAAHCGRDCRQLFAEIDRCNLWVEFLTNLVAVDPPADGALMARWCFLRPTWQIVDAFLKTMEESDA